MPSLRTGCLSEVWFTIPHCTLADWPCLPHRGLSHLASVLQQALLPVWSPHTAACAWVLCLYMLCTHAGPGSDSLSEEHPGYIWGACPWSPVFSMSHTEKGLMRRLQVPSSHWPSGFGNKGQRFPEIPPLIDNSVSLTMLYEF